MALVVDSIEGKRAVASTVRYGWGTRVVRVTRCEAASDRCEFSSEVALSEDRPWLALAGAGHAALAALALRKIRRQRRGLLASVGVEVPAAAGGGSYRQAEPLPVRVLPGFERREWHRRLLSVLGAWACSLAVVSVVGNGASPVPMPLVALGWSALTLPAALAFARWREGAKLVPWLLTMAAGALAQTHSFAAAAPAVLVLALGAWAAEQGLPGEAR